jgi:Uncharacterized protein conserved in cyanobacteria
MSQLLDLPQIWTFEDLQQLPDDVDWRRYEIVDGALVVSPSPNVDHDFITWSLRDAIQPFQPTGYYVAGPLNLDLHPSYRIPDLCIIPRSLVGQGRLLVNPHEMLLAVEIVSPSSRTTDRITKPAEYATAGIPGYWRVEMDPDVTLTAYALDKTAATYTELGTWARGETTVIEEPFLARIAIDDLMPASDQGSQTE